MISCEGQHGLWNANVQMVGNDNIIDGILLEQDVDWMHTYTVIFSISSILSLHTLGLSRGILWKSELLGLSFRSE